MTSQQIVTLACQVARCPGYTSQAGQMLNSILSDLCQDYDLEVARGTYEFNFSTAAQTTVAGQYIFGGPYALASDFLRCAGDKALTYWISGVPYQPKRIDLDEFDQLVQTTNNQNYPSLFAVDLSPADEALAGQSAAGLYLYQPPSGAFAAQLRYYRQMADIATPETSATVPWFPNQEYLRKKLAARLMELTGDSRKEAFDADAEGTLDRYLKMKDDPEGRAKRVKLDRRSYGPGSYGNLKVTKTTGW